MLRSSALRGAGTKRVGFDQRGRDQACAAWERISLSKCKRIRRPASSSRARERSCQPTRSGSTTSRKSCRHSAPASSQAWTEKATGPWRRASSRIPIPKSSRAPLGISTGAVARPLQRYRDGVALGSPDFLRTLGLIRFLGSPGFVGLVGSLGNEELERDLPALVNADQ